MLLKLFWKKNCPKCPPAKEATEALEREGIPVEYLDVETVEGRAEAVYYQVLSTPTAVLVGSDGEEIESWRGKPPQRERILQLFEGP
jgi:thiol-disulfide isomerase/thioredoxin